MVAAAIVGVVAGGWFVVPLAIRLLEQRRLAAVCRRHRAIVLTYDDGPSDELTPRLLELLGAVRTRATFFMIGQSVDSRPKVARRVVKDGHDVGSHSYRHLNAWKSAPWVVASDVAAGIAAVDRQGGVGRHYRPPFGKLTIAGLLQGRRLFRYGWWTVDSRDSWARRPIVEVLAELRARRGGVVLMHDCDRPSRAPDDSSHPIYVIDLTRSIVDFAQAEGFRIVTLSDLRQLGRVTNAPDQ